MKNKDKTDKRLHTDKNIHRGKQYLKDPKRNIVANLGKMGVIAEQPYWIYDEGYNVTPRIMEDSLFPNIPHNESLKISKMASSRIGKGKVATGSLTSSTCSIAQEVSQKSSIVTRFTIAQSGFSETNNSNDSFIIQPSFNPENIFCEESREEESFKETESLAPSMFQLRMDPPSKYIKLKTTFSVNLTETQTIFLLEIPSTAEPLESEEGKLISESNSFYEKRLQTTKAISQAATQTDRVFSKNRKYYIPRNERANASTFVTNWEMYDTYEAIEREKFSIHSREEGQLNILDEFVEKAEYNIKLKYLGGVFSNRILEALMIIERLIINDLYRENHLIYNGSLVQDPLSLDVTYNYSFMHLWTFYSESIVGKKAVTSMSWNKADPNILAVGYGKFYYKDQCNGLVCIWNIKNPVHPERHYEFEHPVTFVTFNPLKNQILAVTFYNGSVLLIDIISWVLLIKANNEHYPLYHPVCQACWFPSDSRGYGQVLITCGKTGKVYRYKKNNFFLSKKIMTIGKVHGKIQGVDIPKPCYAKKTLTMRSPSVEVLVPHPLDPVIYLVGTSDGCVFICSCLHRYDYLEVFQAHSGPVYNIQFNPFCKQVFLTCGMDWCIRIWVEKIYVPLMTLQSGMVPVQDALWSPLHSTVIVSVTGNRVEIWDLRRSTSTPKSSVQTPAASFNSKLYFTANGYNLFIGDLEGNVHVMGMTEMPFSPVFQEDVLVQALKGALIPQPEILQKLVRLGKPFSSSGRNNRSPSAFQERLDNKLLELVTIIEGQKDGSS